MRRALHPLFRRHHRWRALLQVVADGSASAAETAAFDGHARGCARCRSGLDDMRALRAALGALPGHAAPRSFRLTPAMLAAQAADEAAATVVSRARTAPLALRLAQGAAAVAVFGLAALIAADLVGSLASGGSSDSATSQAVGNESAVQTAPGAAPGPANQSRNAAPAAGGAATPPPLAPQPLATAAASSPAGGPSRTPDTPPTGAGATPAASSPVPGSVGAQSAPPTRAATPTPSAPRPPATGASSELPTATAADTGTFSSTPTAAARSVQAPIPATGAAPAAADARSPSRLRVAEALFAVAAVASLLVAFILTRSSRKRRS